jgi:hypothetical protein
MCVRTYCGPQVVYERAVAAFPITHSLWLQYGLYMETHSKLPDVINGVYARAVRNCPWEGAVWERALQVGLLATVLRPQPIQARLPALFQASQYPCTADRKLDGPGGRARSRALRAQWEADSASSGRTRPACLRRWTARARRSRTWRPCTSAR